MKDDGSTPQRLPREHAEDILRRAIMIDEKKSSTLSIDEIRSIALELGVSAASVEQALQSTYEPPVVAAMPQEPRGWSYTTPTFFVIGALFATGAILTGVKAQPIILLSYAVLLLFSIAERGRNRYVRSVKAALALWAGLAVAVTLLEGGDPEVAIPAVNFAISAFASVVAITCRDLITRYRTKTTPPSSGYYDDHDAARPSLWLRTLKKISGWLGEGPMQRAVLRFASHA